ncbi:GNAT family N-acetyltransferase [Butyrivibrio sp. JL13D10]|uniref:GNAT family N-acetyltransferase n=1 Tax=Butyrivibrio sp. JL13D10 TaxID=3236815 RepID=UPI0038B47BD7
MSTRLMNDLVKYAKENRLCYTDLKATEEGYSLYKKIGFEERNQKYKDMRLKL